MFGGAQDSGVSSRVSGDEGSVRPSLMLILCAIFICRCYYRKIAIQLIFSINCRIITDQVCRHTIYIFLRIMVGILWYTNSRMACQQILLKQNLLRFGGTVYSFIVSKYMKKKETNIKVVNTQGV